MESLPFSPERLVAFSIFGSLETAINTANNSSATPITTYGSLTEAACCTRYACNACGVSWRNCSIANGAALKISSPPIFGAIVVPSELKPCVKSSRLDAVSGFHNRST